MGLQAEAELVVLGRVGVVCAVQQAAGLERVSVEVVLAPIGVARLVPNACAASKVVASLAVRR